MYLINILKNNNWEFFDKCYSDYELDVIVTRLTYVRPNKAIQVLQDYKELDTLNGTEEQLFYFKNRYILHQKPEYDYVKEYQKTIKK